MSRAVSIKAFLAVPHVPCGTDICHVVRMNGIPGCARARLRSAMWPGDRFKIACELLNLRAPTFPLWIKLPYPCMGRIFLVLNFKWNLWNSLQSAYTKYACIEPCGCHATLEHILRAVRFKSSFLCSKPPQWKLYILVPPFHPASPLWWLHKTDIMLKICVSLAIVAFALADPHGSSKLQPI